MKKWYVSYTISTEVEAETFDDARAAAELPQSSMQKMRTFIIL